MDGDRNCFCCAYLLDGAWCTQPKNRVAATADLPVGRVPHVGDGTACTHYVPEYRNERTLQSTQDGEPCTM